MKVDFLFYRINLVIVGGVGIASRPHRQVAIGIETCIVNAAGKNQGRNRTQGRAKNVPFAKLHTKSPLFLEER
jgi:hypothetical protein